MTNFLRVTDGEDSEQIEVPTEEDGTVSLESLVSLYPGVTGLKYTVDGHTRVVNLSNGILKPPPEGWKDHVYHCCFPKDAKRKAEENESVSASKCAKTENGSDAKDPKWNFTDLVVLGLPWKTTDKELHEYFSKFGALQLAQVKLDPVTGKSKGFGFVRFADNEVQVRVMLQRHEIDGRWCDVRVPLSKDSGVKKSPCKIFVGQCTEDISEDDLRNHFIKYGEISDVYVPKPFRGFGFVTFVDSEAAQTVIRENHVIKDKKVVVTEAIPKTTTNKRDSKFGGGGRYGGAGGGGGGRGGFRGGRSGMDNDYYGNRYSGGADYTRRYDERNWGGGGGSRYDSGGGGSRYDSWGGGSGGKPNWSGRTALPSGPAPWKNNPTGDGGNLNSDLVAKVVNKAVLGVIENLKATDASDPNSYRERGDAWWS